MPCKAFVALHRDALSLLSAASTSRRMRIHTGAMLGCLILTAIMLKTLEYTFPTLIAAAFDAAVVTPPDPGRLSEAMYWLAAFSTCVVVGTAFLTYTWVQFMVVQRTRVGKMLYTRLFATDTDVLAAKLDTVDQRITADTTELITGYLGPDGLLHKMVDTCTTFATGVAVTSGRMGGIVTAAALAYALTALLVDVRIALPLSVLQQNTGQAVGKLRATIVKRVTPATQTDTSLEEVLCLYDAAIAAFQKMFFTFVFVIGTSQSIQNRFEEGLLPVLLTMLPFWISGTVPSVHQFSEGMGTIRLTAKSFKAFNMIPAQVFKLDGLRVRVMAAFNSLESNLDTKQTDNDRKVLI